MPMNYKNLSSLSPSPGKLIYTFLWEISTELSLVFSQQTYLQALEKNISVFFTNIFELTGVYKFIP